MFKFLLLSTALSVACSPVLAMINNDDDNDQTFSSSPFSSSHVPAVYKSYDQLVALKNDKAAPSLPFTQQSLLTAKTDEDLKKDGLTREEFDHYINGSVASYNHLFNRLKEKLSRKKSKLLEGLNEEEIKLMVRSRVLENHPPLCTLESYLSYCRAVTELKSEPENNVEYGPHTYYSVLSPLSIFQISSSKPQEIVKELTVLPPQSLWQKCATLPTKDSLSIVDSHVVDISSISELVGVKFLQMDNTQIFDISAVKGLVKLQQLSFSNTAVKDISYVTGLKDLESLNISRTSIEDISPVRGLFKLQRLLLNNTEIQDISVLGTLTSLDTLFLGNTKIQDISVLEKLTSLRWVILNNMPYLFEAMPDENSETARARIQKNKNTISILKSRSCRVEM